MSRLYKIEDDIYESRLGVFIGKKEDFNKYLDNLGLGKEHHLSPTCIGRTTFADGFCLIWLPNLDSTYMVGTLIHELHHAVCDIFDKRQIPISMENDETMAYYKAMLFRNIAKKIKLCVSLESAKSGRKKKLSKKH